MSRQNDEIKVSYGNSDVSSSEILIDENMGVTSGEAIEVGSRDQTMTSNIIYIDVSGAVNNASVVEIAEGSRVFQAIAKAGGTTNQAVTKHINLAAVLSDGDKLYIPTESEILDYGGKETQVVSVIGGAHVNTTSESGSLDSLGALGMPGPSSHVNINKAGSASLQTLTGIGPSTAEKIIEYREQNGPFKKVEDLKNVTGIGEKTLSKFIDQICVD